MLDNRVRTRTRLTRATFRQKLSSGAISIGLHGVLAVVVALGAASAGRLATEAALDTTVVRVADLGDLRGEPEAPAVNLQGIEPSWSTLAVSAPELPTSQAFDPTALARTGLADQEVVQLASVELAPRTSRVMHPTRHVAAADRESEDASSPLWSILHPGGGNSGPGGTTGEHGGTGIGGLIGGSGPGGPIGGTGAGLPGVGGTLAGPAGGVTIGGPGQGGIIANPQRGQGIGIGLTFGGPDGPVSVTIGGPGCVTPPSKVSNELRQIDI